jgi:putative phosphoesterase
MTTIIGIISDTHEDVRMIRKAVRLLTERAPALVVHCGDIISPPVLEHFKGLPMRFVFGNNDGERSGLKKKCHELGFHEIGETLTFSHAGRSFFVNHGTNPQTIEDAARLGSYDYVLHGHTHLQRDELIGNTRIINPGALFSAELFSIAFLEPETGALEFVEIY